MDPAPASLDVATLAAGLGTALHAAGLPVGPDRCERLARAVTVMNARTVAELRACALATLVSDPGQMSTFERIFALLFGGPNPLRDLPLPTAPRSSVPMRTPARLRLARHPITTAC